MKTTLLLLGALSWTLQVFGGNCPNKPVRLNKEMKMKCKNGKWILKLNRGKGTKENKSSRNGPNAPMCKDDTSLTPGFCSAEEGHCLQYTDDGANMDKKCAGTCGSCDACRCQDSSRFHTYCPYWAQFCDYPGVLGVWMADNCKKTCNKCKCEKCCSYKGVKHGLGDKILFPDQCGELVCEEGLVANTSQLLPGASHHNISHPEELTLVFRPKFSGSMCCVLPAEAEEGGNITLKNQTMVREGWSGKLIKNGMSVDVACCKGSIVSSIPLQDMSPRLPTIALTHFLVHKSMNTTVWSDGTATLGVFLVGGGGYGDQGRQAGSSGFFKYQTVNLTASETTVSVQIGQGGKSSSINGGSTTAVVGGQTITANGGGGNRGAGWSWGGDDNTAGFSNGGGSKGSGESLPNICGTASLTPGAGGVARNGEGGGGGGVIIDGNIPTRRSDMDGEGYGAGGAEMNFDGYPGAALLILCD